MDGEAVKREVLLAFEYSYTHDDWVHPLADVLTGVTAEDALWRYAPDAKSIWEIVLHMAVWTENIVERMRTGDAVRPDEGAWPPLPADPDAAAWDAARWRLNDALIALRSWIETSLPDALLQGPYGLADLLCRFVHNAYHIGQIVKLREMRAARDEAS